MRLSPQSDLLTSHSHRRLNCLTGKWILVSPHRTSRPWQGQEEKPAEEEIAEYDPDCYLCPGNTRASGDSNPVYRHTYAFVNDFSALLENQDEYPSGTSTCPGHPPTDETGSKEPAGLNESSTSSKNDLLVAAPASGRCLVLSFAASHRDTFADLSRDQTLTVVTAWTAIFAAYVGPSSLLHPLTDGLQVALDQEMRTLLGSDDTDLGHFSWLAGFDKISSPKVQYRYLQVLENKGAAMGCSNKHPHGQIWVTDVLPDELATEIDQMSAYSKRNPNGGHMLMEYARREIEADSPRIVFSTTFFVALVPWWASWPFEILILPRPEVTRRVSDDKTPTNRRHIRSLLDLSASHRSDLAAAIRRLAIVYDNLFQTKFPYSMGIHQAPLDPADVEELEASYLHIHYYPPLLRSAKVRKFWAGYELLTEAQRDLTPECAASRLRACDGPLYRSAGADGGS